MATFSVPKDFDKIQEPELLPEGYYTMEISKDPQLEKNKAWRDAGENLEVDQARAVDPAAGHNLRLTLKVVSDVPEHSGRVFFKRLGMPTPADGERAHGLTGQLMDDWKMDQILHWAQAFGSTIEGNEFTFSKGQKAQVYVSVGKDMSGEKDVNEIPLEPMPRQVGAGADSDAGTNKPPF